VRDGLNAVDPDRSSGFAEGQLDVPGRGGGLRSCAKLRSRGLLVGIKWLMHSLIGAE